MLSEQQVAVVNELRREKYELRLCDFEEAWKQFDKKGEGRIKVEEVEDCVRNLLSFVNIPTFSPYKETLSDILSDTLDHYIRIQHFAVLLPVSGEMLARYYNMSSNSELPSVSFMRMWREFDADEDGYLDRGETRCLVVRVLQTQLRELEEGLGIKGRTFRIADTELDNFVDRLFEEGDLNKDGKLELRELAGLLNVERNFLDICPKLLQQKKLGEIFEHYDGDGSGEVEGAEFLAFVRDLLRIDGKPLSRLGRKESDVGAEELELAGSMIMGLVDGDQDGKLNKQELGVVMEKRKRKLLKHQTEFLKLQASFDKGEL